MDFNVPIKMPRATHYGNGYYVVFSSKIGRPVCLFSMLEYYNFLLLETDPNIIKFCEQPLEIELVEDGKVKKAVFDVWVRYADGREEMQEIKYTNEISGDTAAALRSQEQIRRQRRWCEDNGIGFTVRTEELLVDGPYLMENLSVIAGLNRRYTTPADLDYYNKAVCRYVDDANYDGRKKVLVGELIGKELLPVSYEWAHLAYMYVNGLIDLNVRNKPLDVKTEVRLVCQNK